MKDHHPVKKWRFHRLGEELDPPKGNSVCLRQRYRHLLILVCLVGWRAVDKGGNDHRLVGCRDIFVVEEGVGPILDGFIVRGLGVPITLVAVESDVAACHQLVTRYSLPTAQEAVFEVLYYGCNA